MNLLKVVLLCLGAALMFAFNSCSDEEEVPLTELYPYSDVKFSITKTESTSTSCSFDLLSSDGKVPYLCLYVDTETFQEVPKAKLVSYLMDDLNRQAKAANMELEAFVESISLRGKQHVKIENLAPGAVYELVVFAISGTTPAKKATYQFFQTDYVDAVECSFDVRVSKKEDKIILDVNPSLKDEYWYMAALPKATYDNASTQMSDVQICMTLFRQQAEGMTQEEIFEKLLLKGDASLAFTVPDGTGDCIWLAAVMKPVGNAALALASDVSKGLFNPDKLNQTAAIWDSCLSKSFWNKGYLPKVMVARPQ